MEHTSTGAADQEAKISFADVTRTVDDFAYGMCEKASVRLRDENC